ncbi:MAG: hypothetical protein KGI33_12200 [Thaumarchaeota archaeon]|nr:hypothetical protein [Nitrososphaerota archaeon]
MALEYEECECGHTLIVDYDNAERVCARCGKVFPLLMPEQASPDRFDKYDKRIGYEKIAEIGTITGKKNLESLHLDRLKPFHYSDARLEDIIRTAKRRSERWMPLQDKEFIEMVLSVIEKRIRVIYRDLNEDAEKDAARAGVEHRPIYPPKALVDAILRQVFRFVRMPYSHRKKKARPRHEEEVGDFEKKYWKREGKIRRGRKKGTAFTSYDLWEYCGKCRRCGVELEKGQSVADHMKKHHPEKTIQSGYNWFSKKIAGKRTDDVSECPKCKKQGSLYRRSDGYYIFQHDDSSQHYIAKDMAGMVIEKARYKDDQGIELKL